MSDPEQKSFATTYESLTTSASILNGHLFAGFGELVRLNGVTCRSLLNMTRQHWERTLSVQSMEQLVRAQADLLPSLAVQMAGYSSGWMDIVSETAAQLGRVVLDCKSVSSPQIVTFQAAMATDVGAVDAITAVMKAVSDTAGAAPAATPNVASQNIPSAEVTSVPAATSTATSGRRSARGRRA